MNKNLVRTIRKFLALLLFPVLIVQAVPLHGAAAASVLTASLTVDHNKAEIHVSDPSSPNQAVTLLIVNKQTNSVVFMDQASLEQGKYVFMTLLPKGEYSGYVSSAGGVKAALQDFRIEKEERITGFKPLRDMKAALGGSFRLPGSVIAEFDSGANREVGVQWTDVPTTDVEGLYTITGQVKGSEETVRVRLLVGAASPTPTPTSTPTPTPDDTSNDTSDNTSAATPASTRSPTPVPTPPFPARGSTVTVAPVLDSKSATAQAEVSADALAAAFAQAAADRKGVQTVEIIMSEVPGAKAYEAVLPASALAQGDPKRIIEVVTPIGRVALPGHMVGTSLAASGSTLAVTMERADRTAAGDPKLAEAVGNRPVVELRLKADGKPVSPENLKAPFRVSIPYHPQPGELAKQEHIGIWSIDGTGQAARVPNAKYDPATGTVAFRTASFSRYAVSFEQKTFEDAGAVPWAKSPIEVLASKGVINGTSEASFTPEADITRADFLVLLVRALGLKADFSGNFSDVRPSDYYYEALGIAKQLGISNGMENNAFRPEEPITRQDLMVLSARALRLAEVDLAQGGPEDLQSFRDKTYVAPYAADAIASMVKEGLVSGSGDLLRPDVHATRAETAVILYRILSKLTLGG